MLDKVLKELIFDSKGEVRSAACVWLVSLCTFTGKQPQLLQRLPQIQEAFSNLLGDSSELAQVDPGLHAAEMQVIVCRSSIRFLADQPHWPIPTARLMCGHVTCCRRWQAGACQRYTSWAMNVAAQNSWDP